MVSWTVAVLVMFINGYLMVDFFSNEAQGVVFGSVVCAFTAAYAAFIVYLVSRAFTSSLSWFGPKSLTDAGN